MAIDQFEAGDTVQFTFVASVAPDAAPTYKVTGVADTVIASITAVQSSTTAFYALFTMPTSVGIYVGEWLAKKTFSGSAYDFITRFLFKVDQTRRVG